jgi:putative Holliday junction resolvase
MTRAIGVDFGLRRVGVAVADELGKLAHARPHLDGRDAPRLIAALCELAKTEAITTFVIGLPKSMDGSEGLAALRVRRFAAALAKRSGANIDFVDERLTSVEATRRLREQGLDARKMKGRIDGAAAAIVLQCWLDSAR